MEKTIKVKWYSAIQLNTAEISGTLNLNSYQSGAEN